MRQPIQNSSCTPTGVSTESELSWRLSPIFDRCPRMAKKKEAGKKLNITPFLIA